MAPHKFKKKKQKWKSQKSKQSPKKTQKKAKNEKTENKKSKKQKSKKTKSKKQNNKKEKSNKAKIQKKTRKTIKNINFHSQGCRLNVQSRETTCALDARVNQPFTRNLLAPGKKLCFGRERFFGVAGRGRRGRRPYSLTQYVVAGARRAGIEPGTFSPGVFWRARAPHNAPPTRQFFLGWQNCNVRPCFLDATPEAKKNSKQAHTKTESQKGQKPKKARYEKTAFFFACFRFFIFWDFFWVRFFLFVCAFFPLCVCVFFCAF